MVKKSDGSEITLLIDVRHKPIRPGLQYKRPESNAGLPKGTPVIQLISGIPTFCRNTPHAAAVRRTSGFVQVQFRKLNLRAFQIRDIVSGAFSDPFCHAQRELQPDRMLVAGFF